MNELNLNEFLPPVVLRYRGAPSSFPIFLAIPDSLPKLHWRDDSLERLIQAFVDLSVAADQMEMPVQLTAFSRLRWTDLDDLVEISPSCWVHFRIEMQSIADLEKSFRELPERFGYRKGDEWQAGSNCKLISYNYGADLAPAFFLSQQKHKASFRSGILIPVSSPAAHA